MASTTKLQLKFGTMSGVKTWTFGYMQSALSANDVNAAMDAMITNGSIYKYPPLTKDSATLVKTETTTIALT